MVAKEEREREEEDLEEEDNEEASDGKDQPCSRSLSHVDQFVGC